MILSQRHRSWLTLGLVLVGWLRLASSAGAQAPTYSLHGVSADAYQTWINKIKKEGFRPAYVSVGSVGNAAPQFSALAVKDGKNLLWEAHHGLTAKQYSQHCDDLHKKGLRVLSVSGYRDQNTTHFAAVWVKDGMNWIGRHDLTQADYRKNCDELYKKGFRVSCVSGYPVGNDVRFVGVWVADKKPWIGRDHLTEQQYVQAYDELWPKGLRPESITAYPLGKETRFAVVFTQGAKDDFLAATT